MAFEISLVSKKIFAIHYHPLILLGCEIPELRNREKGTYSDIASCQNIAQRKNQMQSTINGRTGAPMLRIV